MLDCWLSYCSLADSWIKSLQPGPLFCLELLEEMITVAVLRRWRWWFPEQQIEAYPICSKGVLDCAAKRWKHALLTGEGCRLQLFAWSWVLRSGCRYRFIGGSQWGPGLGVWCCYHLGSWHGVSYPGKHIRRAPGATSRRRAAVKHRTLRGSQSWAWQHFLSGMNQKLCRFFHSFPQTLSICWATAAFRSLVQWGADRLGSSASPSYSFVIWCSLFTVNCYAVDITKTIYSMVWKPIHVHVRLCHYIFVEQYIYTWSW